MVGHGVEHDVIQALGEQAVHQLFGGLAVDLNHHVLPGRLLTEVEEGSFARDDELSRKGFQSKRAKGEGCLILFGVSDIPRRSCQSDVHRQIIW